MKHIFSFKSRKKELVPGTIIECKSGRYMAYYEHRTDIIANGENEKDAKKNLKEMYAAVAKFEQDDEGDINRKIEFPKDFTVKRFKDKLPC
jgi:predicted RNase H-like HicB family nuclease